MLHGNLYGTLFGTVSGDVAGLPAASGISEYITNGTFDADENWTKGAGWTIGSGVATCTADTGLFTQDFSALVEALEAGMDYTVSFTLAGSAGDTIRCRMSDGSNVQIVLSSTTNGSKQATFTATHAHTTIQFFSVDGADTFTIDNASLRPA